MINASYTNKSSPGKIISYSYDGKGICLFGGKEVKSLIDILELKGSYSYNGSFVLDGNDFLDINNANRDRYPVTNIVSLDMNFNVLRSQAPLDMELKTNRVAPYIKKYLSENDVNPQLRLNFTRLIEVIYSELCAKPMYVFIDLSRTRKDFSYVVVDIVSKILKTYPIYIYAPTLFDNKEDDLSFTNEMEEILHPKQIEEESKEEAFKESAMASFMRDLEGKEEEEETPQVEVKEKKPAKAEIKSEPKAKKDRGELYNFCFSLAFALLSSIATILPFAFKQKNGLLNVAYFILAIVVSVIGASSIVSLNRERKDKYLFKNKYLALSVVCASALYIITGIVALIVYKKNQSDQSIFIILFEILCFSYPILMSLYVFFLDKFVLKLKKRYSSNN